MNKPSVSFLFGSGFSIPDGVPSMSAINEKLRGLKETDFYLWSDQTAGFYHSNWSDPNGWMPSSYLDRLFAQEFTAFYCREFLNGNVEEFNYEKYYDFITDFLGFKINSEKIHIFCESFNEKNIKTDLYKNNDYNWVWRFKRILNQLIADLLFVSRYYEDVGCSNYPYYGGFFGFLREILKDNIVNVHTLNHDLFFDYIGSHLTDLWQNYTDGYTEYGSTYYGEVFNDFMSDRGKVHKEYKVRLKFYDGEYDNALRLFKLHGSIDSYVLLKSGRNDEVRIKKDFRVREFLVERFDEVAKKYIYERPFTETYPDFLSGTTDKIRQYNIPFYERLFKHFKDNLLNATKLFVIGYGFQDKGINDFIEQYFLIYHKPMVIIDIKKPENGLLEQFNSQIEFKLKGVCGYGFNEYCSML